MILYVNGDENTAAARAVNDFSFADDDFSKVAFGHKPHPDNLAVSWGSQLSKILKLALICDAESNSSNERILRTTYHFLETIDTKKYPYLMVVIGWSDWTRTEFLDSNNEYIQVGIKSDLGEDIRKEYRDYLKNLNHDERQKEWHDKIWDLHQTLEKRKIPHLFFNSISSFDSANLKKKNWKGCYVDPYLESSSFTNWLEIKQYKSNADGHLVWANRLKAWLITSNIN